MTSKSTAYTFTTRISLGSKGNEVIELQKILISQGYLKGTPDGVYGRGTLLAVKAFQIAHNLTPDGIIGTKGRAVLNTSLASGVPSVSQPTAYTPNQSLLTDKLFYHSNNLSQVKILQTILTSKDYLTGTIDGVFGRGTLSAVKAFQRANNLTSDGIVGAKSREILNR